MQAPMHLDFLFKTMHQGYGNHWSDPEPLPFPSWSKENKLISIWGIFHYIFPVKKS